MKSLFVIMLTISMLFAIGCSKENDDGSPTQSQNHAPVIQSVTATPSTIVSYGQTDLSCIATDQDGDSISYIWSSQHGYIYGENNLQTIEWYAPGITGQIYTKVIASDGIALDEDSVMVTVQ